MPGFTESSITLDFPDNNFFRFEYCQGYNNLSGYYFKEMDACWFDIASDTLWLIELKDFSLATLSTPETMEKRSWDILKKCHDSLCMILSSKHSYSYAHLLNPCFPQAISNTLTLKFVTIIHCDPNQRQDIQLLNEMFKRKFKPYADLFGVVSYTIVEHSSATRFLSFVS